MRSGSFTFLMVTAMVLVLLSGSVAPAAAEGAGNRTAVALDPTTFITVKDTVRGEIVSLYKVLGDRVVLVDVAVNTATRSYSGEKRYLHHEDVDNK